jgi:4'-phosphopantetheinyl transferase EntD
MVSARTGTRLQSVSLQRSTAQPERSSHQDLARAIARLAPPRVGISAEAIGDTEGLLEPEADLVASAVWKRRVEFAAGRRCARTAIAALGGPRVALLCGAFMEPLWPSGYAGSISHDGGVAAALACRLSSGPGPLGLDLVDLRVHPEWEFEDLAAVIVGAGEGSLQGSDENAMATLFSVKEAAIKILSPRERRFVDFKSIRLVGCSGGALLLSSDTGVVIEARSSVTNGILASVAWLPGK